MSFLEYSAAKQLLAFSKNPLDLTAAGVVTKERCEEFQQSGCGLKLLYASDSVERQVLAQLFALAIGQYSTVLCASFF